jgi:hypothetical protein
MGEKDLRVTCLSPEPPDLGRGVFYNQILKRAVLTVPAEALEKYKNAEGWKDFGTIKTVELPPQSIPLAPQSIPLVPELPQSENAENECCEGGDEGTIHFWIGTFDSPEDAEDYIDNEQYAYIFYGHMLGEDNFDELPEPDERCPICGAYDVEGEDEALIGDYLKSCYFEDETDAESLISLVLSAGHADGMDGGAGKAASLWESPIGQRLKKIRGNTVITLTGWPEWEDHFKKALVKSVEEDYLPKAVYIGMITENDKEDSCAV